MARTWLIDGRGIASKVKNPTQLSTQQIKDSAAYRLCPKCYHRIDNSDVSLEWPGLPAGVKFDPSDVELLEHLAGKVGFGNSAPHCFIDEFIPTLEGDEGICYTHPENLPGAKKDGSSIHFFHKTSKAYATGNRKRRKVDGLYNSSEERVRWHKTGKTKAVIDNGMQKGCKKIMVLYRSSKKGSKPDKFNWVMHQYHLGTIEDEKESEFVVSKIFYQQHLKQTDQSEVDQAVEEPIAVATHANPTTPMTYTPNPPRLGKRPLIDEIDEDNVHNSPNQAPEMISQLIQWPPAGVCFGDEEVEPFLYAGESQPVEEASEFPVQSTQCPPVFMEDEKANPLLWAVKSQAVEESQDPNSMDTLLYCNENVNCDDRGLDYLEPSDLEGMDFYFDLHADWQV